MLNTNNTIKIGRGDNGMPHWVAWTEQNYPKMEQHLAFVNQPLSCGLQLTTSSCMFLWVHVLLCAWMSILHWSLFAMCTFWNEKSGLLAFILCVPQHENKYLDWNDLCDYIVACHLSMSMWYLLLQVAPLKGQRRSSQSYVYMYVHVLIENILYYEFICAHEWTRADIGDHLSVMILG